MEYVEQCQSSEAWDDYVLESGGHPLQLSGWGELKAAHGWKVERVFVKRADKMIGAGQVLLRPLPWPLNYLAYLPRGPVVPDTADRVAVLELLARHAREQFKAAVITVEPDWTDEFGLDDWKRSDNTILIPRTLILDLTKSEDELLADMSKKTRQYIRKSAKEAVGVRQVKSREDLTACLEIYHQTAERAGFSLHDDDYYYDVFDKLGEHSPVLAAYHEGRVVAFLWPVISRSTAFELYGGMNDDGQRLRANYTLKWESVRLMKKWGIDRYDMNGLLNDGVSTFKQGFSSHEDMLIGTFDKPLSPLYPVWDKGLPIAKKIVRKIKNR